MIPHLSAGFYGWMTVGAFAALAPELFVGFGLCHAPGWANGWPGGLTIHRVWSAGMTICLFVIMGTLGIGTGGLIGLTLRLSRQERLTKPAVFTWLAVCAVLSVLACMLAYHKVYLSTLEMWPNGYPALP